MQRLFACAAAAALVLSGCGGGGAGGASPPPGTANVRLHITDAGNAEFLRVFVRIYQADLQNAALSRTVFQSPAGVVVDFRALGPEGGRLFRSLGGATVDAAVYTNVSFIADTDLFVVDVTGSGMAKRFAASLDAGGGRSRLTAPLTNGTVSGVTDVLIDFDLSAFTEDASGRVLPVLRQIGGPALGDPSRFVPVDLRGVVTNLTGTAPDQSFDLRTEAGTFRVLTNSATLLLNEGPSPNPRIAEEDVVEAGVRLDAGARQYLAVRVEIEAAGRGDPVTMRGVPLGVDGEAGRFELEVAEAAGLLPSQAAYTVVTTGQTVFKGLGGRTLGRDDFWFDAIAASSMKVEGRMDGQGRLEASRLFIEESLDEFAPNAEVEGAAVSPDQGRRTFAVEAIEFEGFAYVGPNVPVNISEAGETFTSLEREDGTPLTTEEFFAALAARPVVNVTGIHRDGRIEATWVIVRD
jgi:hypothetical protein